MRVEIVKELDPGDATLEVPWASLSQPESRYIDLKAHPEEIGRLQECRNNSTLVDFLRRVNSAASAFRTAKCDVWTAAELAEDERHDFQLPLKVGSYVDLLFDRPDLNAACKPYLQLAEKVAEHLAPLRVQAQAEACIRRCLFLPEGRWGYYLTAFVHGYGTTPQQAETEWSRALAALGDALAGIDQIR